LGKSIIYLKTVEFNYNRVLLSPEMIGMMDFIFIVLVLAFFGVSFWYLRVCDRL
jgi:hypothetical protein